MSLRGEIIATDGDYHVLEDYYERWEAESVERVNPSYRGSGEGLAPPIDEALASNQVQIAAFRHRVRHLEEANAALTRRIDDYDQSLAFLLMRRVQSTRRFVFRDGTTSDKCWIYASRFARIALTRIIHEFPR